MITFEDIQFAALLYLVASFILLVVSIYRNYDFYIKMARKKTDEANKELDRAMERGDVTPMERDARVQSYTGGYVEYFIIQVIRAPIDAPVYFYALMVDVTWNDVDPGEPE